MSKKLSNRIRGALSSMKIQICGCHRNKDADISLDESRRPVKRIPTKDNFDIIISADEKLRSLGHKSHPLPKSNSYCGVQSVIDDPLTSLKSSNQDLKSTHSLTGQSGSKPPDVAPPPIPGTLSTNQKRLSQSHDPLTQTNSCDNPDCEEAPPLYPKPRLSNMAERRLHKKDDSERSAAKRRTRSAGPQGRRRMRNSMHETTSNSKSQYSKPAANGRYSMYAQPFSDEEALNVNHSGSDMSVSDDNEQTWTKNPLMVKKAKRGDRSDKRKSSYNVENGMYCEDRGISRSKQSLDKSGPLSRSKELFIYPVGKPESSPSSNQKAKFQRLEENRKKRIDMTVTSDEECSPQLRISRLRQRAMMSSRLEDVGLQRYGSGANIRSSVHDENRLSKYDDDFNNDNVEHAGARQIDNYVQPQVTKQKRSNIVLPEYIPEFNSNKNIPVRDASKFKGHYDNIENVNVRGRPQVPEQPRQTEVVTRHVPIRQQNEDSRRRSVKVSSESPKLRSFQEVKPSQPSQLKKAVGKIELTMRSPNSSSDSLDELIESNIQYLESEIESGKLKRQSGSFTNVQYDDSMRPRVIREPLRQIVPRRNEGVMSSAPFNNKSNFTSQETKSSVTSSYTQGTVSQTYNSEVKTAHNTSQRTNVGAYGSATYSPYMQRKSYDPVEDLSKSDSQLNSLDTRFLPSTQYLPKEKSYAPYPVLNKQTGNIMYVQPDDKPQSEQMEENSALNIEKTGMFSDVEYDIEVSERIKKWEKKLTPRELEEQRKVLNTIKEYEYFSDADSAPLSETPMEIRRELRQLLSPSHNSGVGSLSINLTKSASSLPDAQMYDSSSVTFFEPKVVSSETNLHRIFRVVHEPRSQSASQPVVNVVNVPPQRDMVDTTQMSQHRSRPAHRSASLGQTAMSESEIGSQMQQSWPPLSVDSDSGVRKSWRMSRYEDEINELKEIVSENFRDLRKRFDSDVSETDTKRESSPVFQSNLTVSSPKPVQQNLPPVTLQIQAVTPSRSPITVRRSHSDPRKQYHQNKHQQQQQQQEQQQPQHQQPQQVPKQPQMIQFTVGQQQQIPLYPLPTQQQPIKIQQQPKPQVQQQQPQLHVLSHAPTHTPPATPNLIPMTPKTEKKNLPNAIVDRKPSAPTNKMEIPIKQQEVWSPNMESGKGLISIERVKARTLQTIPFSEDPVWKEIEGLATFDRSPDDVSKDINFDEIDALLKIATGGRGKQHTLSSQPTAASQSITLSNSVPEPNKTVTPVPVSLSSVSTKPSFNPPIIQPLKLSLNQAQKSSSSALDEVLEDIRMSLQKKPLSPKHLKNLDSDTSSQNVSHIQSPLTKSSKAFVFPKQEKPILAEVSALPVSAHAPTFPTVTASSAVYDNVQFSLQKFDQSESDQTKSSKTFAEQAANVPYIDPEFTQYPYIINGNYHLDPDLLADKLKKTGLVNESTDALVTNGHVTKTPAMDQLQGYSVVSQPALKMTNDSQKKASQRLDESVDDLKSLAQEVEFKLNQIKSKIVSADEQRLDHILLALRKFAPMTEQKFFNVKFTPDYESERVKRSKLEDAITELDRMYDNLDLDDKSLMDRASRVEETGGWARPVPDVRRTSDTNKVSTVHNVGVLNTTVSSGKGMRKSQIEEVERQTQNEFEDITKSFQVLLDEVARQCKSVANVSSKYATKTEPVHQYSSQPPLEEVRHEPQRQQLRVDKDSQRALQDSFNNAIKELEDVACGKPLNDSTAKQVQSSVYVNLDANTTANENINESTSVNEAQLGQARSSVSSDNFNSPPTTNAVQIMSATMIRETSSSDTQEDVQKKGRTKGGGRFRKRGNLEHRKSMPALTRSIETQTVETQTEPPLSVQELKDKYDKTVKEMGSDSGAEDRGKHVQRKMSSGMVKMIDLFSSSEDERGSKMKRSHSVPDLVGLCQELDNKELKSVNIDKLGSSVLSKAATPKSVKHRNESKSRFKSLQGDESSLKKLTMPPAVMVSSAPCFTDDLESPRSKPPVYPVWKYPGQVDSPSPKPKPDRKQMFGFDRDNVFKVVSDSEEMKAKTDSDVSSGGVRVVLRRTRSVGSEHDDEDRPTSFHELVACFEKNPARLEKIRDSGLRTCVSEDSLFTDHMLQKLYNNDHDFNS